MPERGSSNHRTKILKANSRRAPCAGDLWGELNDGSTHCQPPYCALQAVDTLVTVQFAFRNDYKPQRSISCPPSHETSPTTVCAACSSASRMTFLSDRLVHGAKQPASLAIAPRGLARRRSSVIGARYLLSSRIEVMPRTDVMPSARP